MLFGLWNIQLSASHTLSTVVLFSEIIITIILSCQKKKKEKRFCGNWMPNIIIMTLFPYHTISTFCILHVRIPPKNWQILMASVHLTPYSNLFTWSLATCPSSIFLCENWSKYLTKIIKSSVHLTPYLPIICDVRRLSCYSSMNIKWWPT